MIRCRQRNYELAIADATEAIRLNPKEGYYYFIRAAVYQRLDKYDEALADYANAMARQSRYP